MNRPGVVIDTNVLVSAAIKTNSAEEAALLLVAGGFLALAVSPPILEEYTEVLRRPKFKLNAERVDLLLQIIKATSTVVIPTFRITASLHVADNRFLECAEAFDARYLVTGNKRHFPASWKNTEIVNARELQQRLSLI